MIFARRRLRPYLLTLPKKLVTILRVQLPRPTQLEQAKKSRKRGDSHFTTLKRSHVMFPYLHLTVITTLQIITTV